MLKKLELINFQIHKHLVVDLSDTVTTIIGPSDEGKSAIKRALMWVCLNQPAGNDFMNWDEGVNNVSVSLTTDLGIVTRSWNKGENLYTLKYPDKDIKEYKAFGRNVPEPIEQFLQMSNVNFQGQHDQPFWFCNTSGEVSRNLNKIVNLDLIDTTLANLDALKRTEKTLFTDRAERVTQAKNKYTELHYVEQLNSDMTNLKQKAAISITTKTKYNKLLDAEQTLSETISKLKRLNKILSDSKSIIKSGNEYNLLATKIARLESHICSINKILPLVDAPIPNIDELAKYAETAKELKIKINKLTHILIDVNAIITTAKEDKQKLEAFEKELKELTKGLCPICQTPMK